MTIARWWWVRHAPTADAAGRLVGRLDHEADLGDTEAIAALARTLPAGAAWITSPLARARATAAALGREDGMLEPDFREQDFGTWEGALYSQLEAEGGEPWRDFWADPGHRAPPDGESFAAVMSRVAVAVARHSQAPRDGDIVCVCHAGVIRAALAQALDLDPSKALSFAVGALSCTRIDRIESEAGEVAWRVLLVNRLA